MPKNFHLPEFLKVRTVMYFKKKNGLPIKWYKALFRLAKSVSYVNHTKRKQSHLFKSCLSYFVTRDKTREISIVVTQQA